MFKAHRHTCFNATFVEPPREPASVHEAGCPRENVAQYGQEQLDFVEGLRLSSPGAVNATCDLTHFAGGARCGLSSIAARF